MSLEMHEITLAGPGKNALGTALMTRVLAEIRGAAGKPLLVSGAGDAFSAGLDLKEVAALDPPGMERYLGLLDDLVDALYGHPAPTVACVNGHAIAGGCVVALCCDLRVAADDPRLRIGLNEVPLGLEFPPKILALVRRRVPPRSLERVVLEGALHDPRRALELGLVDEIAADARAAARARLALLATHPRAAYAAAKQALRSGALDLSAEQRRDFRERLVPAWCAHETRERVRAMLRGRG
ncbi:MAG TPA: enoyl-CoA hydratase/isomerase family protein [Candidatus Binatia bacterium]|nr:enoyl-CoA hydratase/isomerase family protein [Candidatus Binatia bacterium]